MRVLYTRTPPGPAPARELATYKTLLERHGPPTLPNGQPATSSRALPASGCYWASGVRWWQIRSGTVLLRAVGGNIAHNGHRWVRTVLADLHLGDGTELHGVALPSSSLSRDVEPIAEWAPVRIVRDGHRRPWRAVTTGIDPAWHERADQLNGRAR